MMILDLSLIQIPSNFEKSSGQRPVSHKYYIITIIMVAKLIHLIHVVGICLIWLSGFVLPAKYVPFAFIVQLATLVSWVMFDGCILWTWEKQHNPDFRPSDGSMTRRLFGDIKHITDTIIYLNFLILSCRMGNPMLGAVFVIFYFHANEKISFRGDDDLSKYD
jgi:hypothetical protein